MIDATETRRRELIQVCQRNDRNGVWTDEDCRGEGMDPATVDGLSDTVVAWLWDSVIGELRRILDGELSDDTVTRDLLTLIVRQQFARLFGRDILDRDGGTIRAVVACVVWSDYGNDLAFDVDGLLAKAGGAA